MCQAKISLVNGGFVTHNKKGELHVKDMRDHQI